MNINNLIQRIKNILLTPKSEWKVISSETPNSGELIIGYLLPLTIIPAIAMIIGITFLGFKAGWVGEGFGNLRWALANGISYFLGVFIAVIIAAFVIDILAPTFRSEKNFNRSLQLVIYSNTPFLVAGILYIIPILWIFVYIFGLYNFYLVFVGLTEIKKTPEESKVGYLLISVIVLIVAMLLIKIVLLLIARGIFFHSVNPFRIF